MFDINIGRRHISLGVWTGLVLLAFAISLHIDAKRMERPYYSEPLAFPISTEPKTISASHMDTYLNTKYDIAIDVEGEPLRASKLWVDCDVWWKLWDGTQLVAQRSLSRVSWQDNAGILEGVVGSFDGKKGHHYSLVIQASENEPGSEVAHAILKVQIPRGDWEGYLMEEGFKEIGAAILAVFGGMMVLERFFTHGKPRPAPNSTPGQPVA